MARLLIIAVTALMAASPLHAAPKPSAPASGVEAAEPPPPAIDKAPPDRIAPPGPVAPRDRKPDQKLEPKNLPETSPNAEPIPPAQKRDGRESNPRQ